jgi:hypothetical protein
MNRQDAGGVIAGSIATPLNRTEGTSRHVPGSPLSPGFLQEIEAREPRAVTTHVRVICDLIHASS